MTDNGRTALLLVCGIILIPFAVRSKEYILINQELSWDEARRFCRANYTDLASIETEDEQNSLPETETKAWIGLFDPVKSWKTMTNDTNSWIWSATEKTSATQYQNWAAGEPDFQSAQEECVLMVNGMWTDTDCGRSHGFVCHTGSVGEEKEYFYISQSDKDWWSSREHCRAYYNELAVIEDEEEQAAVWSLVQNHRAWIGLHRTPWRWSDGSSSLYRNWDETYDNIKSSQHCATLLMKTSWGDELCSDRKPFICYNPVQDISTVRIRLHTEAELSDPAVRAQFIRQIQEEFTKAGKSVTLSLDCTKKGWAALDEL